MENKNLVDQIREKFNNLNNILLNKTTVTDEDSEIDGSWANEASALIDFFKTQRELISDKFNSEVSLLAQSLLMRITTKLPLSRLRTNQVPKCFELLRCIYDQCNSSVLKQQILECLTLPTIYLNTPSFEEEQMKDYVLKKVEKMDSGISESKIESEINFATVFCSGDGTIVALSKNAEIILESTTKPLLTENFFELLDPISIQLIKEQFGTTLFNKNREINLNFTIYSNDKLKESDQRLLIDISSSKPKGNKTQERRIEDNKRSQLISQTDLNSLIYYKYRQSMKGIFTLYPASIKSLVFDQSFIVDKECEAFASQNPVLLIKIIIERASPQKLPFEVLISIDKRIKSIESKTFYFSLLFNFRVCNIGFPLYFMLDRSKRSRSLSKMQTQE